MGEAISSSANTGMAYTDGYTLDDGSRRIQVVSTMYNANPPEHSIEDRTELLLRLIEANFILSSATARRGVLLELGGFDTSVTAVDDFDLWLRILAAGYGARRTADRLVIQRERSDSQSKDPVLMARAHLETLTRLARNASAPDPVRAAAEAEADATRKRLEMLNGQRPAALLAHRAKLLLGRTRRRLLGATPTYDNPPAVIAEAFPDLDDV